MPELESGQPIDEGDRDCWIVTYTGRRFHPLDPKPEEINIRDIAHALSNMPRFTGHTKEFYSVAQHSYLVSCLSRPNELFGLLHDASEAYLCDISTPVKHSPVFDGYREAEKYLQNMILLTYGFRSFDMPNSVRRADIIMGVVEGRKFMPEHKGAFWTDFRSDDGFYADDAFIKITVWDHKKAENMFLSRWEELTEKLIDGVCPIM